MSGRIMRVVGGDGGNGANVETEITLAPWRVKYMIHGAVGRVDPVHA